LLGGSGPTPQLAVASRTTLAVLSSFQGISLSFNSIVDLLSCCQIFTVDKTLTEHERRQLTIARLPNLRRLNGGSDISDKEREQSERNFIRRFHDSEAKPCRYFSYRYGHFLSQSVEVYTYF